MQLLFQKSIEKVACLLLFRLFVNSRRREELSVLGGVRHIDQHPSAQPELRNEHRKREQQSHISVISRPDDVQKGVEDEEGSSNGEDVSQPTGEDTPEHNGQTQKEKMDSGED